MTRTPETRQVRTTKVKETRARSTMPTLHFLKNSWNAEPLQVGYSNFKIISYSDSLGGIRYLQQYVMLMVVMLL